MTTEIPSRNDEDTPQSSGIDVLFESDSDEAYVMWCYAAARYLLQGMQDQSTNERRL